MGRKAELFAIVTLLFLGSIHSRAAESEQTSAQLFGAYAGLISDAPLSRAELQTLRPELQKAGFSTSDGIYWRMSDSSGRVLIVTLPDAGRFSVMYTPSTPTRLGDSALAALIGKSANVEVDDGDVILITVGTKSLSKGQRTGTRMEYLKFNLRGGMWQETGVHVDWK